MGRKTEKNHPKSHTLPSSPTHSFSSSSSSDFEFTISLSPLKSSSTTTTTTTTTHHHLCPADELFYKGQLLPLHLSPRLSMVRTLLLSSSSTSSSSDTTTTASRDSTASTTTDCDSSRPSSVAEEDELKRLNTTFHHHQQIKKPKYFSLSRFSSVFRKSRDSDDNPSGSSVKRMSATAKEVIRKYLKKVKPLYEKLSQKQNQKMGNVSDMGVKIDGSVKERGTDVVPIVENSRKDNNGVLSHSFSGNLGYPRKRRSIVSSCPSSMRSSPSHSGILYRNGFSGFNNNTNNPVRGVGYADASSMEELQSAIQGAIAHCKNSMVQNKSLVSDEM
ncbi:hypothetical protein HYC85_019378 [Camellia sinensis]|uniref:Membrane-associated kinase regulator 1 n=1 Tax=Camellia sinensis TaxID=4442 RepID=A0A7J7GQH8_CAMSI|nr:hypothetical protein HYC85_019378 [Camellia sinensis]